MRADGRMRVVVSVSDRAGRSVADREAQLDEQWPANPPGAAGAASASKVEVIGPDFLEYLASYPVSRAEAGERAFAQFRADHAQAMGRPR